MKKPKRNSRPGYYFCELYQAEYYFFIGWDATRFADYMKKNYDHVTDIHPACVGKTILLESEDDNGTIFIWVGDKDDLSSLAHEALHASNFTLSHVGWVPDLENDEPQAYLLGNIILQAISG